jgi:hypothetical protein
MTRIFLACGVALLLGSQTLLAQQGRRRGSTAPPPAGEAPAPDDLTDFTRAVLLQATPEQVLRFQRASASLDSARHTLQQARLDAANSSALEDLSFALTDVQIDGGRFLASFSEAQRSGLKEYIKKFVKANDEVTRKGRALQESNARPATFQKIDHALDEMQSCQAAMGNEMGISAHAAR